MGLIFNHTFEKAFYSNKCEAVVTLQFEDLTIKKYLFKNKSTFLCKKDIKWLGNALSTDAFFSLSFSQRLNVTLCEKVVVLPFLGHCVS